MEIKHTVEILTKDIQEIEKLVRNLNNSPAPPRIDLDLALSKLRNVYELLSMIREDIEHPPVPEQKPLEQTTEPMEEIDALAAAQSPPLAPPQALQQIEPQIVPQAAPQAAPQIEKQAVQTEIPMEEPVVKKEEHVQHKKEAEILAEKFSNDPSINENIAGTSKSADLTSKITGQPIDNIGRNIGINDRFLIIRELFEGDNDNYTLLIKQLDSSSTEQEAIGLLEMRFPQASEHEGYLLLIQLTKRKFISG